MLFMHKYIQNLRNMFGVDLVEEGCDDDFPPVELKNEISTVSAFASLRVPRSPELKSLPTAQTYEWAIEQLETSLDKAFYRHNANQIRTALLAYMKHCLDQSVDDSKAFQDGIIFCYETEFRLEGEEDSLLDSLIKNNPAIVKQRKNQLLQNFVEFDELRGLFQEMKTMFGVIIAQELIVILDFILRAKLSKFRCLAGGEFDDLIPRMNRFWGDQNDQKLIVERWDMQTLYDYDEINGIAEEDCERIGSEIYFSQRLKYLILATNRDMIREVNLLQKFTNLITFLSSTFLLTIAAISQKQQDVHEFLMNLHYATAKDGKLGEESLTKRVKNQ